VVVVPLEELHRVARDVPFDEAAVVLLQSTGRCGSTLLSKVFAALPGVASWSEPDAFTQLAGVRPHDGSRDREIGERCESCLRVLCRPLGGVPARRHVVKFRSQAMELSDLLFERLPRARTFFMYRDAIAWIDSVFRSLLRGSDLDDEQRRRRSETGFGRYHRLIGEHARPDRALSPAATWTLGWVSGVEKYLDLSGRDPAAFAVRYEALRRDPEAVVRAVLEELDLCPDDFEPVREVLERDSQAGTSVARSEVGQAPATEARFLDEAAGIVASRPRIGRPDLILPRTLPREPSS
jgi:hypothetical protein